LKKNPLLKEFKEAYEYFFNKPGKPESRDETQIPNSSSSSTTQLDPDCSEVVMDKAGATTSYTPNTSTQPGKPESRDEAQIRNSSSFRTAQPDPDISEVETEKAGDTTLPPSQENQSPRT
jgi:hypothetical protein